MTLTALYNAGAVRRWHTNPHMALIRAALTHDDGEHSVGDIPGPAKAALPTAARDALDAIETAAREAIWGPDPVLTDREALWLRYADRLDAYMTAERAGAPMDRDGWPDALVWIAATAVELEQ